MEIIIIPFFSLSGLSQAWLFHQLRRQQIKLKSQQSKFKTILVFDKQGNPEYKGKTSQSRVENQQNQLV